MKNEINILHISDLHFNIENATEEAYRTNVLNEMILELVNIEKDWKPQIIVISGDIAYHGKAEEYIKAKDWISLLHKNLGIPLKNILVCPGNHDLFIDNVSSKYKHSPTIKDDADQYLTIENFPTISNWFNYFNEFCENFVEPVFIGQKSNFLVGVRKVEGFRELEFIIINSAWYSRIDEVADDNINRLWIGLPFLEVLKANNQINDNLNNKSNIKITLMHHPKVYLNTAEYRSYDNNPSTFNFLTDHTNIMLIGHSHNEFPTNMHRINDKTLVFESGATYLNKKYKNNFSIFKIDVKNFHLFRLLYIYHSYNRKWEQNSKRKTYPIIINEEKTIDSKLPINNFIKLFSIEDDYLENINYKFGLNLTRQQSILIGTTSYNEMLRESGSLNYKIWLKRCREFLIYSGYKEILEGFVSNKTEIDTLLKEITFFVICLTINQLGD